MVLLFGLATVLATVLGGLFALRKQDTLHLILGFSAGAVVGVAFFDLIPEAISLAGPGYGVSPVMTVVATGFLLFMILSRFLLLHPHNHDEEDEQSHAHVHEPSSSGVLGAGSLSLHSFLDGIGIGLAFQVSSEVGFIVAAAVLAHDFSDGINTVSYILKHKGGQNQARNWLLVDALAPLVGVMVTRFFSLPEATLGLVLALFAGFFLYIGASDLLPESQHRHPKLVTSLMTILGAAVIYFAVNAA